MVEYWIMWLRNKLFMIILGMPASIKKKSNTRICMYSLVKKFFSVVKNLKGSSNGRNAQYERHFNSERLKWLAFMKAHMAYS